MKWYSALYLVPIAVGFSFVCSIPAFASDRPTLHLDESFVQRPVQMEVVDTQLMVGWKANGIPVSDLNADVDSDGVATVHLLPLDSVVGNLVSYDIGLPSLSTTSTWDDVQMEVRSSSGTWTVLPSRVKSGWRFATVSSTSVLLRQRIVPHGLRVGMASWYRYKSCRCAASPDFPKGTALLVSRADDPTRSTVIKVNDFGPERDLFPDRAIDLDYEAFKEIGNPRGGTLAVTVEPLSPKDPRSHLAGEKLGVKKRSTKK